MTNSPHDLPPQAPSEDDIAGYFDKCMHHDAPSIRAQLQQLIDQRCTLVASGDGGAGSMLTAPLALEGDVLWVDVPRDDATREQLVACPRLTFNGTLNRVTLRFSTGRAVLGSQEDRPALQVPVPEKLLHLQRRELMRREPPPNSLTCVVPALHGVGEATSTTIRDIGGGGLAVLAADAGLQLARGDVLDGCVIELPEIGPLEVTLRVCHIQQLQQRGKLVLQAGCEFIDLPPATQSKLFRYLMQLDREQVARRRERNS